MIERFNGRVQQKVLGTMIYNHRDREIELRGFNADYNGRRQRVLKGLLPEVVLRQGIEANHALVNPACKPLKPGILRKALQIVADARRSQNQTAKRS